MEAKDAGANLVVIDPTYTIAAQQATKWVPIKPGTDPALGMAMLNAIIANEWYDLDFMREKTCAPLLVREDNGHFLRATDFGEEGPAQLPEYPFFGTLLLQGVKAGKVPTLEESAHYVVWDADKDAWGLINDVANPALEGSFEVNGVKVTTAWSLFKEHMAECTPEWAEGITEVSADTIVELARMYSQDTPSTIYAGYHLYDNCEEMGMTWACLAALTGNIGKRGASIGHLGKSKPTINMAGLAFPAGLKGLNDELPWLHLPEVLETGKLKGEDFPVRLLYNIGANPVGSYAAQRKTIEEILPKIPCIVTNDMEFSETCEYSDIVLPLSLIHISLRRHQGGPRWGSGAGGRHHRAHRRGLGRRARPLRGQRGERPGRGSRAGRLAGAGAPCRRARPGHPRRHLPHPLRRRRLSAARL